MTLSNNTLARSPAAMGETLSEKADRLALDFATRADRHDVEGSFVAENYACLKDAGLIEAGVPAELGGGGATVAELADMLRQLADALSVIDSEAASSPVPPNVALSPKDSVATPDIAPAAYSRTRKSCPSLFCGRY